MKDLAAFESSAARDPRRIVLRHSGEAIEAGRLNARADRIGGAILAHHIGNRPVVVLGEDSAWLAASLVGALKAGATYVPLDPADPHARLADIVADLQPALILSDPVCAEMAATLSLGRVPRLSFGALPEPPGTVAVPADLRRLAWVMYTSGSTGRPKGVMQTCGNVWRYADQVINGLALTEADRLLLASPLSVHGGCVLTLAALVSGASLSLVNLRRTSVEDLGGILAAQEITAMFAVPTVFRRLNRLLMARGPAVRPSLSSLRLLRLSGETVTREDLEAAFEIFPGLDVFSVGLGSTEGGGIAHAYFGRGGPCPAGRLPVGRAVDGVEILLLDAEGRHVPEGAPGEIVAIGESFSPGYWGNPELTAAVFTDGPAGRRYHTGDLGRLRPDGLLEHLGRKDSQVKVRGRAVDLAEIEGGLRAVPGVREAAVRFLGPAAPHALAAYLTLEPTADLTDSELRQALARRLPTHMIPSVFMRLPSLPLTFSGKVDLQALPGPFAGECIQPRGAVLGEEPDGAVLHEVLAIWQAVVESASPVDPTTDFLAAGGDSIQAVGIMVRIEARFGVCPSLSDFFDSPSPRGLTRLVSALMATERHPAP